MITLFAVSRAEDPVDEHHGLESDAQAAQASAAHIFVLPAGSGGTSIAPPELSALFQAWPKL